jgi:hypothetical protein
MACGCGGGARAGMAYKVMVPGEEPQYVYNVGEARLIRTASDNPYAVVIMQVSKAEADKAMEAA